MGKSKHVVFAFFSGKASAVAVFVFYLNADYWAAVFCKETFYLLIYFLVVLFNLCKICLVVGAGSPLTLCH